MDPFGLSGREFPAGCGSSIDPRPRVGQSHEEGSLMLAAFKRHPFPVTAFFKRSLVLAYAVPAKSLEPRIPPGMALDTFHDLGFFAIALVQTRGLRPLWLPSCCGQSFFLAGYRIFVKYKTRSG